MSSNREIKACAYLMRALRPRAFHVVPLIAREGYVKVMNRVLDNNLPQRVRDEIVDFNPEIDDDLAAITGDVRLVTRNCAEWPLSEALNKHGSQAPIAIGVWVKGKVPLSELTPNAVAMTGSYSMSRYGRFLIRKHGAALARAGLTVVTNASDQASANYGAVLESSARTVTVTAYGIDVASQLSDVDGAIRRGGLLVSASPLGTGLDESREQARDVLTAAFARGVLVPEATRDDPLPVAAAVNAFGGLIGRRVYAFHRRPGKPASPGTRALIKAGAAIPVTSMPPIVNFLKNN